MASLLQGGIGNVLRNPRVVAAVVGVAAIAAIVSLARWGTQPDWVAPTTALSIEKIGEASDRLDEAGIPYRLERGGSLLVVPESEVARARVLLAGEGMLAARSRPGFELFDQPSWGMTDFTQRVNLRRALEGELERTIGAMRGVEDAQVHLALRESTFVGEAPKAEASVVLRLAVGSPPDEGMVEGIRFLVASSVEDVEPSAVMVLDDRGRLLSQPDEDGTGPSLRQLQVRREIEGHLERKAEAVLSQLVGPGNATVRVAAELTFDRVDRTVEQLDPAQQVTVSEGKSQITPGTADQGAAQSSSNTVFETPKTVETVSRGGPRIERLTVAVVVNDRSVVAEDGTRTTEARGDAEIERLRAAVANAVGVSGDRGDEISVVSLAPDPLPEPAPPAPTIGPVPGMLLGLWKPIVAVIAVLAAALVAFRLLGTIRATAPAPELAPPPLVRALPTPEPEVIVGTAAGPMGVGSGAEAMDPRLTANLLSSWMRDS